MDAVKHFFPNKFKTCNNMVPNEKHKTVKDVKEIPSKFDKFFAKIIK